MMTSKKDSKVTKCCKNCYWLSDEFTSVCVNGISEHRADFVSFDDCCPEWEGRNEYEKENRE